MEDIAHRPGADLPCPAPGVPRSLGCHPKNEGAEALISRINTMLKMAQARQNITSAILSA